MGRRRLPSDILLRRGHYNWQLAQLMLTERPLPITLSVLRKAGRGSARQGKGFGGAPKIRRPVFARHTLTFRPCKGTFIAGSGFAAHEDIGAHRSNSTSPGNRIRPPFRDRVIDTCRCRADNHFRITPLVNHRFLFTPPSTSTTEPVIRRLSEEPTTQLERKKERAPLRNLSHFRCVSGELCESSGNSKICRSLFLALCDSKINSCNDCIILKAPSVRYNLRAFVHFTLIYSGSTVS